MAAIKLNVGCGFNILPEWINIDITAHTPSVIPVNVLHGLPFPDGLFDYVFNEHFLEHLSREQGVAFLRECLRVLKPGGTIRIVAPDLDFLWGLMHNTTPQTEEYCEWVWKNDLSHETKCHPVLVVNHFLTAWGHKFMYTKDLLGETLVEIGFADPRESPVGFSDDPELTEIDNVGRMPDGYLALESLAIEARKPG